MVKDLTRLLFELSSPERLKIMLKLQKVDLKLSQISRILDLTVTETSRHLQRLSEAKLVQKNPDGLYGLSRFGHLTLLLLGNLDFASANRNYFEEYDISGVPNKFILRLGDFTGSVYSPETFRNIEDGEKWIREAQEFVWIMSDEVLSNTIPVLMKKVIGRFDLRIILPDGKFPPENASKLPTSMGIQKRTLPKVNVLIVITEKHAVFCLPNKNGRIDYSGFVGDDTKFHTLCKELFLYWWDNSKPVGSN